MLGIVYGHLHPSILYLVWQCVLVYLYACVYSWYGHWHWHTDIDIQTMQCLGWHLRSEVGLNEEEPNIDLFLFWSPSQGVTCSPLKILPCPSSNLGQWVVVSYFPSISGLFFTPWLLFLLHVAPHTSSPPVFWQGSRATVSKSRETRAHCTCSRGMQVLFWHHVAPSIVIRTMYHSLLFHFLFHKASLPQAPKPLDVPTLSLWLHLELLWLAGIVLLEW